MDTPREPPVVLESKPLEMSEEFESRRLMEESIIAALKDDSITTIGICGIGGIGKTRMARRIGEKVKKDKLFKVVMMVTVGPSSDFKRIAYEISDYLSVRLEGEDFVARANELLSKLIMEERVLIILDDVREILDLEKIGIPLQKHSGSYKIMIASRFESVCLSMGCREIFTLRSLTKEDIRLLSEKQAGICSLERSIGQKSEASPLAVTGIGGMSEVKSKFRRYVAVMNRTPALSASLGDFARASVLQKSEAVHMPRLEAIKLQYELGGVREMQGWTRNQTSLNKSLPPRRGLVRLQIFESLASNLAAATRKVAVLPRRRRAEAQVFKSLASKLAAVGRQVTDIFLTSGSISMISRSKTDDHFILSTSESLSSSLQELVLRDADIQVLPPEMKNLTNLRVLDLTNCRKLQVIEPGTISSLVCLEELYMLGSFSEWEVEEEGKIGVNASINELESLQNLTALQIQIQDPSIIPITSRMWSRLTVYVISTPKELKCRYQESLNFSFPAVNLDDYYWQFQRAMDLHLPGLTSLIDWICVMLRTAEYLCLTGDGSKNAVDELIPEGFKLLKQLNVGRCSTIEYLMNGVAQVVPTNGFFPFLESLCLEELPQFKEICSSQLPVGLFGELRNLKLYRLPSLLHVHRSPTQDVFLSNLRSVHISHCPKLQSLFPLSVARDLMQLEEIKIEYCEMMEEIFSEEKFEDGKVSNKIQFSKLNCLELDTLPRLTDFSKNVRVEFPQLREIHIQSMEKLRAFCPTECALSFEENDSNGMQFLFNEKVTFGSLKELEITELNTVTGIWSHQSSPISFSELEVLVVESCDTLGNLFSYSIAKVLVQLEHLIVRDCSMMQEVIADDGEIGQREINESLFPRLKKLELRRLPILESFCHMMNGLELPLLEDLTLYDCPGMKEFSGGKLNMPMLRCVRKDLLIYRIDGVNYSVQNLFNDKHLFAEVEYLVEEGMKESIYSHLAESSQADAGMNQKRICSTSTHNTMAEGVVANSLKNYLQELGLEGWNEDVSMSGFCTGTKANGGQIEEINNEVKSGASMDMVFHDKRYLKDFMLFSSMFPSDYEFTKDLLVWLWIAGGLIKLAEDEMTEKMCFKCFDMLLSMDYIVASRYDHFVDQMKYKIGDRMIAFLQEQPLEPKFQKYLDSKQTDMANVEHLSLAFEEIDGVKFGALKQYSSLQTLIMHRCYVSKVNHLPADLFLELKALKILNLSHTNILELPSSVENLQELRFLDLSQTPIGWLPETIFCFGNLQTLNLDGCLRLDGLPKCTSKLINLRHLILDVVRQLEEMPTGMGRLSKLQTLSAFLVGEDEGCSIVELKNMNKLRGSFRVLNLENVNTQEEAAEACLYNKKDLRKIELQWSYLQDEKNPYEEEILEFLQPPFGVQELEILFYSGGVLPSWICNPSFSKLVKIILYRCRYCCSLPSLGELPSLEDLSIVENNEVMQIDSSFCRKQTNRCHVAFPKLEKLSIDSMLKLEKWTGLEKGDFPSLRHLVIEYCPKFVGLQFLSHMNSLLLLEISYCPELSCLPEDGLPSTLESLIIKDCPKLKERCCGERCEDWSKVARVPFLCIDNQKVSP